MQVAVVVAHTNAHLVLVLVVKVGVELVLIITFQAHLLQLLEPLTQAAVVEVVHLEMVNKVDLE